jgi:GNAT superfamily N-acetyltransferase
MIPTLRTATPEDAELIARLTRECWVGKPEGSSGHRETAASVRQNLQDGEAIIMELAGVPVGSVRYYPVLEIGANGEKSGPVAPVVPGAHVIALEIGRLGILPEHRGRGLSTWLMNEVTMRATLRGIQELRLAVRQDEPGLLEFYKRQGFFEDASIVYNHANPHSPKPITMRKFLFDHPRPRGDTA